MTKQEYNNMKQKECQDRRKYEVIYEIMKEAKKVLKLAGHDIKLTCDYTKK